MDERVRRALAPQEGEAIELVDSLVVPTPCPRVDCSFFEGFSLCGICVDHVELGFVSCSFTVPPRHIDRDGNFSMGAIANLADEVGRVVTRTEGDDTVKVSVDMSITEGDNTVMSWRSQGVLGEEYARTIVKGGYAGTIVVLRNKATGEVVAEGRHSLFGNLRSKI